ncbi:MAG: hypothetical protein CM1200mP2_15110 [Planctomycetaceae bacterium]|nr:MAG: hypothetical protein CM1200mP2_15110 [Planctomycetaceae bacterium]
MDVSGVPGHVGGELPEFTLSSARKEHLSRQRKSIKVMCRDIQLGVASAVLALADAEIDSESIDRTRLGVDYGADQMFSHPESLIRSATRSSSGVEDGEPDFRISLWGESGIGEMEPLWLLKYLPNMPACHIAIPGRRTWSQQLADSGRSIRKSRRRRGFPVARPWQCGCHDCRVDRVADAPDQVSARRDVGRTGRRRRGPVNLVPAV